MNGKQEKKNKTRKVGNRPSKKNGFNIKVGDQEYEMSISMAIEDL